MTNWWSQQPAQAPKKRPLLKYTEAAAWPWPGLVERTLPNTGPTSIYPPPGHPLSNRPTPLSLLGFSRNSRGVVIIILRLFLLCHHTPPRKLDSRDFVIFMCYQKGKGEYCPSTPWISNREGNKGRSNLLFQIESEVEFRWELVSQLHHQICSVHIPLVLN